MTHACLPQAPAYQDFESVIYELADADYLIVGYTAISWLIAKQK